MDGAKRTTPKKTNLLKFSIKSFQNQLGQKINAPIIILIFELKSKREPTAYALHAGTGYPSLQIQLHSQTIDDALGMNLGLSDYWVPRLSKLLGPKLQVQYSTYKYRRTDMCL